MSFAPILPFGGLAGWSFLQRTMEMQTRHFDASPQRQRDEAYFRERIGSISTAEGLVDDRRLLRVALGAFGLEGEINNRYFIRKVLEDGTLKDQALSNRLADKQYRAFSAAFGFGDFSVPRTKLSDFADTILTDYRTRQFEQAVGAQHNDLRLSLNAEREIERLAARDMGDEVMWFTVMGNPPLRQVFERAFGLPSAFSGLDLDRQLTEFRDKASRIFGESTVAQFADPEKREKLLRNFLLRSEIQSMAASYSPAAGALQLLQSMAR
ncbi:DUF1217 domain-containing protein [Szabonella alba]|uniref:DUF1217 domain-containing protein n=1 Tax=Szabonella alba TaxID=2804194 RepID=A0A8K0XZP4_9RHOB|nr:DUF1217 domain-containing protein [Szabonella alba]MBL4917011.1 DUF1217 domain-containing protein [Szabonella alba]